MLIKDANMLIVDCQATGANPEKGYLIEIGWMNYTPNLVNSLNENDLETYLIQLPDNLEIPQQVQRVTGISSSDLKDAVPLDHTWDNLSKAASRIQSKTNASKCPLIIHFAKYEVPFLRFLHQRYSPQKSFPFDVICTHEIVKRLMPELPRKGLRAIAGYFGFSTPEKRRCEHHLRATPLSPPWFEPQGFDPIIPSLCSI